MDQDQVSQLCLAVRRESEEWATPQDPSESNKKEKEKCDGPAGDGEIDDEDATEEETQERVNTGLGLSCCVTQLLDFSFASESRDPMSVSAAAACRRPAPEFAPT